MNNICKACGIHKTGVCEGDMCIPFQNEKRQKELCAVKLPEDYNGLRFTSDAMDCALPIALDSHSGCSFSCIAEGMKIMLGDGNMIPIEELKIGDIVLSYDENDKPAPSVIIRMSKKWATNIMSINSGWSHAIRMTEDHLVKTTNGYIPAGELTTNDQVLRVWKCVMSQECIKSSSERMTKQNPMKDPEVASKVSAAISEWFTPERRAQKSADYKGILRRGPITEAEKDAHSERMKNNNPMKDPVIAAKSAAITREQYASGERKSPHLYKYGMGHYSDGQKELYDILDSMGLLYQKEFSIKATEGCPNKCRIYLDAAIPEQKINIEYDGFPYHTFKGAAEKDQLRDEWLAKNGWTIIRIAGDEIQNQSFVKERLAGVGLTNNSGWNKIHSMSKYNMADGHGTNRNALRKSGWVYDIETDPHHNFVVGNQKTRGGIVVHNCQYCFANNLSRNPERNMQKLLKMKEQGTFYAEWGINHLKRFLNREAGDKISRNIYNLLDKGMPIQLGALGDPCDHLEEASGWLLKAIPLFIEHKIPIRVGTKGAKVMMLPKYRDAFHQSPEQFWFSISLITSSDKLLGEVDVNAPSATERLAAMKAYSKAGHRMTLRMRPFLPGISDKYPGEPEAWKTLLEKAADAGAKAVSFEFIFLQHALTLRQQVMYHQMFKSMSDPKFGEWWNADSDSRESCRRGSREFKYDLTMKIREKTHELGMRFGCSDPHFKELNDEGNCCFINPHTPIMTIEGWKPIKNIKPGDLVLTHKGRFRKVKEVSIRPKQEAKLVTIYFQMPTGNRVGEHGEKKKEITVTEEHPLLLSNGNWVAANKIKKGDEVKFLSSKCAWCGKEIPFYLEFCSQSCQSSWVADGQWKKEDHVQNMSTKAIAQHKRMKEMYPDKYPWSATIGQAVAANGRRLAAEGKHAFQNPEIRALCYKAMGESGKGSYIEKCLEKELIKRGIEHVKQYPVFVSKDSYRNIPHFYGLDFAIPDLKIAIECDGDYWHSSDEAKKKDKIRQNFIEEQGWQFLRFTGNEIKQSVGQCVDQVQRLMQNHNGEYGFLNAIVKDIKYHVPATVDLRGEKNPNCKYGAKGLKIKPLKPRRVTLYNFSVEEDESYIAKGFVVHNCGLPAEDKWFGGWSRRQLTNVIVEMRKAYERGENLQVNYNDWRPEWAHHIKAGEMIAYGSAAAQRIRKFHTFGDTMRIKWNNPKHPRSPFIYFAGVMRPVGIDQNTNDLVYEYRDWERGFDKNKLELNFERSTK